MQYSILLLSLFLALLSSTAFSQEEEAPAATTEENAAPDTGAPQKPQRLSSSLERARIPDSEDSSMKILGDHLSKESLLWLDTEYGRFLSLWQKDRSGYPKGALMIIHAEGEHPAWPNTTKPLHDTLPDYGWATLAISLPTPDQPDIPQRTLPPKVKKAPTKTNSEDEADAKSSEQEKTAMISNDSQPNEAKDQSTKPPVTDKANMPSAEMITEKRLEAALRFLHDQGQFNLIILGSGSGAIRAHSFIEKITPKIDNPRLKAKLERPIRAIVLINGRNRLPTMDESYQEWFNDPEIPVLDIFVQGDQRNLIDAKKRKVLARQAKVTTYKQVRLSSLNPEKSWNENGLSRRVRSFLDSNAVGIEVKNAKLRRYK